MFRLRPALLILFLATLACPHAAHAQQRLAVLEFTGEGANVSHAELTYLADKTRGAALKVLDASEWEVMTRENMLVVLETNAADLAACMGECEVETGRLIGAHQVVAGSIVKLGDSLRLTLKAFNTESGRMLGFEEVSAAGLEELADGISVACGDLWGVAPVRASSTAGDRTASRSIGTSNEEWSMDEVERHVVRFDSDPSGASVSLDGSLICNTTPCSKEIAAGGHDVEMVLARYEPATRTIDVRTKETIEIPLSPLFGWLSVETSVSGVTLVVDGEPAGESPIRRFELTPGRHMVLTDDGEFQEVGEEFTIERGREHRVELDVTRRLGGLRIRAVDENDNALSCTAYVRRHKVGETPWSGEHRVGQHDWMVACHERGSKSGRVEIPFQKVVEVVARFDSEIEVEYDVPLIGPLIKGIIAKKMKENVDNMLAAIKARVETE